ncbi:MAG: FAD:protein FMN transferase [Patescibacteria group bacterium]|jgi:thiamine biosynthesis lipoprotein
MSEQYQFEAIGTHWTIDILGEVPIVSMHQLSISIDARIAEFNKTYSRFRADSLVSQIAKAKGVYAFPEDAGPLFALYERVYKTTNGRVTPLIGQVMVEAGYDAKYSLVEGNLSTPPTWAEAMQFDPGTNTLEVFQDGVLLDFGAAGKGYLIDIVSELIEREGFSSYIVDAGGDIRHRGTEPIRVGLEHPGDTSMAIGIASLSNKSICGSAGNRRAWGRFHHIIDPFKLESPRHIIAVWTLADSTILADAMTTALMFAEPAQLQQKFVFEYLLMFADSSVEQSAGFPAELFTA